MTTGRINQVHTIGGARARRAPPARVRAPTRAHAPQGSASRRAPSRFVGRHAASARSRRLRSRRPGGRAAHASPRASEERASGRAGGRAAHAGWPPRALARQPPACAALSLGPVQAASDARARLPAARRSAPQTGLGAELPMRGGPLGRSLTSPRPAPSSPGQTASRLLLVHTFGAPAPPRVKPWRAPRYCQAAYCDSNEGVRPIGHSQRASPGTAAPTERHLQVTRRPPLASRPGPVSTRRRTGARIRTPHGRPPARAWLRRRAELAPWPPPEALPPCALRADPTRLPHTICSGTMRACENGGPPPLPFSGGELLPSQNGRGGERPPPPPLPFSGGEERRARRPAGRARARGRD